MALNLNNKNGEKVFDPNNSKGRFEKIKKNNGDLSKEMGDILSIYLNNMEIGKNVSGVKGGRGYARLNTLRSRLIKLNEFSNQFYKKDLFDLDEESINAIFKDMDEGIIKKTDGKSYKSVGDYAKVFKAFFHWYQKHMKREKGIEINDIEIYMDTSKEKPKFNYITIEQLKKLCDYAKYEYKVLMWFLFDSGIRSPTELMNIKGKDITEIPKTNYLYLNIRDEVSKTFGRKIKLMLCCDIIKKYIKDKNIGMNDFLFTTNPVVVNQYLKRIGHKVLGIGDSEIIKRKEKDGHGYIIDRERENIKDGITMYDFRHCSACYWVMRYKNESVLKYRFGWKRADMINYYTEFLGMKDTITENDLIDDESKTIMQKELENTQKEMEIMRDEMKAYREEVAKIQIQELVKKYPKEELMKK